MTAITIEALGLSRDELIERIVDRAAENLTTHLVEHKNEDGDDESYAASTTWHNMMREKVTEKVNQAIEQIALHNVLPNVAAYVENTCLQETNKWGEKTGKPVTFTEYLVQRAESYLSEKVNYEGKSKEETRDGYGFQSTQTRITHLVHKHLHYSIESATKEAVQTVQNSIAEGLAETVKIKLAEFSKGLKVAVAVEKK